MLGLDLSTAPWAVVAAGKMVAVPAMVVETAAEAATTPIPAVLVMAARAVVATMVAVVTVELVATRPAIARVVKAAAKVAIAWATEAVADLADRDTPCRSCGGSPFLSPSPWGAC